MVSDTTRAIMKRRLRAEVKTLGLEFLKSRRIAPTGKRASAIMDQVEAILGRKFLPIGIARMAAMIAYLKGGVTAKPAAQKSGFYETREWRELRYQALKANDGRCELCGASKHEGVQLHVDHILPRSKFPALQLEVTNLQVLCRDCNLGKSNKDQTDWRASPVDEWSAVRERLGLA